MEGSRLGSSADGHIGGQQGEAEGQRQHQINKQEHAAPVLGGKVGKPPDIADAHSASGGGQDKADGAGKAAFWIRTHGIFSLEKIYAETIIRRQGPVGKRFVGIWAKKPRPGGVRGPGAGKNHSRPAVLAFYPGV